MSDFDLDQEALYNRLRLLIRNDGESYRTRNPEQTVAHAYREHQIQVLEALREDFSIIRADLVEDTRKWHNETKKEPE